MKRRDFLRLMGLAGAVGVVPAAFDIVPAGAEELTSISLDSSEIPDGYHVLPNSLLLQWGSARWERVSFPCEMVCCYNVHCTIDGESPVIVNDISGKGFTLDRVGAAWLAIGLAETGGDEWLERLRPNSSLKFDVQ